MENRAPPAGRAEPGIRRPWLIGIGLAVMAAAGFWWLSNAEESFETNDYVATTVPATTAPPAAAPASIPADATAAPSAAVIVDEHQTPLTLTDDKPSVPTAPATSPATSPATAAPVVAVARSERPIEPRPAAAATAKSALHRGSTKPTLAATHAATLPPAPSPASARRDSPDLLATLLDNIKHPPSEPVTTAAAPVQTQMARSAPFAVLARPQKGSDQDALDALVRQVRERDARTAAVTTAAVVARSARRSTATATAAPTATATAAPIAGRSEQVQLQLRQCPRANTTAGIKCRQKVCASVGGADAACPRQ